MGFLKLRQFGKYEYFYWCERRWSKKRQGGDGTVKSVELCLGRSLFSSQVAFYCWAGDLPVEPFLDYAVRHWLGAGNQYASYTITLKPTPVLSFRSKGAVDLRDREIRAHLNLIKKMFADLCRYTIDAVPARLAKARQCLESVRDSDTDIAEYRRALAEYQADPDRVVRTEDLWHNSATGERIPAADFDSPPGLDWEPLIVDYVYPEDYGEQVQKCIDQLEVYSLAALDDCKSVIDRVVQLAPKQRRRETREQLLREFKLA